MEQPNYAKQLLMQLNQQRSKGYLCDVIIVVESALFRAHKNILAASSSYFKSLVLHDNLINLDTEMVKPSVFRQVLDFIYTGRLPHSDHISDPGVSALLTAASYLQLSDLATLCRRRLKLSSSSKTPSSTTSSLTPNRHLFHPHRLSCAPLRVSHNYRSVSMEVGRSQKEDLSEEELFIARCVSLNPPPGVKVDNGVEMGLTAKSPTGSTATEEVSPSSLSSDDLPSNSTSAFCNPRPEQGEDQSQQKARKRSRPGSEGSMERMASGQGKRQVASGERVHGEERASSELEDQEEVREGEAALENDLENSEESVQSESEEEEPRENKDAGYIYYQPQPGFEPALGDNLYVCIPCRKGFPSSEQLNAHVDSHTAEELSIKVRDAEEGRSVKGEDRDAYPENLPSQSTKEDAKSDQLLPCHICSVCSKSYVDAALLRQHEKSHWLTRPFPCSICGKLFTQRGTMTRHMRSHLGLKPFACEECGMRFTRQYRLTEHTRVHSGEKPYECRLCGGKFTQQRNLISHLRMHTSPS
ncbi:hypermethylated in cancer 2 protein [Centroberyx gerrardi]